MSHGVGLDLGSQTCRTYAWKKGRIQQVSGGTFLDAVALVDHVCAGRKAAKELETRHCNVVRHITASMSSARPVLMEWAQDGATSRRELGVDELAAFLFDEQRVCASSYLQGDVQRAVLALPQAQTAAARRRLSNAAAAAGITQLTIAPSPAMAGVYWAYCARVLGQRDSKREFLVIDVGSCHASVSAVKLHCTPAQCKVEILESLALEEGGYGTDLALAEKLSSASGRVHDILILNAAEKAKKELSSLKETVMQVKEYQTLVDRTDLEAASAKLLPPLKALIRSVVVRRPSLSTALLIGGSSRNPHLHDCLRSLSISTDVMDSDFAAVMGAALTAGTDINVDIVQKTHAHEYWACESAPGGKIREMFRYCNTETLPETDSAWWVFQRLRGSAKLPKPVRDDFESCFGASISGVDSPARPKTDATHDADAEADADAAEEMRRPDMTASTLRPLRIRHVTVDKPQEEPVGLDLRELEGHIMVVGVKPGSVADTEEVVSCKGWRLVSVDENPVYSVEQLVKMFSLKAERRLSFEEPADMPVPRPLHYIGKCWGGALSLNPSGAIEGVRQINLDDAADWVDDTKRLIQRNKKRLQLISQLADVRNDLDEAVIRGNDDIRPALLNRINSRTTDLLSQASDMLRSVTDIDLKRGRATRQLTKMSALAKMLLHILGLHDMGRGSGGDKLTNLEAEFDRATITLDAYDSDDPDVTSEEESKASLMKKKKSRRMTMRKKSFAAAKGGGGAGAKGSMRLRANALCKSPSPADGMRHVSSNNLRLGVSAASFDPYGSPLSGGLSARSYTLRTTPRNSRKTSGERPQRRKRAPTMAGGSAPEHFTMEFGENVAEMTDSVGSSSECSSRYRRGVPAAVKGGGKRQSVDDMRAPMLMVPNHSWSMPNRSGDRPSSARSRSPSPAVVMRNSSFNVLGGNSGLLGKPVPASATRSRSPTMLRMPPSGTPTSGMRLRAPSMKAKKPKNTGSEVPSLVSQLQPYRPRETPPAKALDVIRMDSLASGGSADWGGNNTNMSALSGYLADTTASSPTGMIPEISVHLPFGDASMASPLISIEIANGPSEDAFQDPVVSIPFPEPTPDPPAAAPVAAAITVSAPQPEAAITVSAPEPEASITVSAPEPEASITVSEAEPAFVDVVTITVNPEPDTSAPPPPSDPHPVLTVSPEPEPPRGSSASPVAASAATSEVTLAVPPPLSDVSPRSSGTASASGPHSPRSPRTPRTPRSSTPGERSVASSATGGGGGGGGGGAAGGPTKRDGSSARRPSPLSIDKVGRVASSPRGVRSQAPPPTRRGSIGNDSPEGARKSGGAKVPLIPRCAVLAKGPPQSPPSPPQQSPKGAWEDLSPSSSLRVKQDAKKDALRAIQRAAERRVLIEEKAEEKKKEKERLNETYNPSSHAKMTNAILAKRDGKQRRSLEAPIDAVSRAVSLETSSVLELSVGNASSNTLMSTQTPPPATPEHAMKGDPAERSDPAHLELTVSMTGSGTTSPEVSPVNPAEVRSSPLSRTQVLPQAPSLITTEPLRRTLTGSVMAMGGSGGGNSSRRRSGSAVKRKRTSMVSQKKQRLSSTVSLASSTRGLVLPDPPATTTELQAPRSKALWRRQSSPTGTPELAGSPNPIKRGSLSPVRPVGRSAASSVSAAPQPSPAQPQPTYEQQSLPPRHQRQQQRTHTRTLSHHTGTGRNN